MTVCSGAAPLPAGWAVQSTSTSPVACLPETNNPIYNLNNNVEVIVGPALPKTPLPTINVTITPQQLIAGQPFTETWSTANATSMTRYCSGSVPGLSGTTTLPVNGSVTATASAAWAGTSVVCNFTAIGPGGSLDVAPTVTTVAATPAPTINLTLSPNPMVAGQPYSETFGATNATSLTYNCTSTGTGWTANTQSVAPNSSYSSTASAAWVGYPTSCLWTATGPGGTTTYSNTYTTVNPPPKPTINLTLSPNPMVAGKPYSETFGATNATSLTFNCTSTGTGWTANNQPVTPNSSFSNTASASWVGYPTNCVWTATGPGGTTTYSNTYVTVNN